MKIRTVKYIIKEGMFNTYRNKLMSLASVSIITASLIIFGIFYIIVSNLDYNTKILKQQPQMQVFCDPALDDAQVKQIEDVLKSDRRVKELKTVSKQEAYEKVKELLGNSKDVLEGIDDYSFLPVSFIIKLKDPEDSAQFASEIKKVSGISNIRYAQNTIEIISKIANWVEIGSSILVLIMLVISMFIIANTIKLTVFARRKEINIMKYIGATDWFIRWPFVVEGVIIGLAGAAIALLITGYGYNIIEIDFNKDLSNVISGFIKLIKLKEIGLDMFAFYSVIGILIGAAGSFISIRKYLRV